MIRIKNTGLDLSFDQEHDTIPIADYSKIKVGLKTLEDAVVKIDGTFKANSPTFADKDYILQCIEKNRKDKLREISLYYFRTSGIYSRLCRYMAYLYRYDWKLTPHVYSDKVNNDKLVATFNKALLYLDNFKVKKTLSNIALNVVKNGCFYGYIVASGNSVVLQELPPSYCRTRFYANGRPAIEFNMSYFDRAYPDYTQRAKVLKAFPPEFSKGYELYKKKKLEPDYVGDTSGWYLLDVNSCVKFSLSDDDMPLFISVIPAIIDLNEAQGLDRKKMAQRLLKIIIQKMPINKDGDLIFDVDEAQQLHNNAVRMLGRAIGVDVLTTFADVEVADMSDRGTTTTVDELAKVERTVYNEAGISQMQFNTSGNLALEKSIRNDEASMGFLIFQFEEFLNFLLQPFNTSPKKYLFKVEILPTTWFNYQDLSKLYKEQVALGYSKVLPQIALGRSQSDILADAHFENEVLNLAEVFIPPMQSSTMSPGAVTGGDKKAGRPEKEDDEKAEKTIQNKESQS